MPFKRGVTARSNTYKGYYENETLIVRILWLTEADYVR